MPALRVASAVLSLCLLGPLLGCSAKEEPAKEADEVVNPVVETGIPRTAPAVAEEPASPDAPGADRAVVRQAPLGANSQMTAGAVLAAVDKQDFAELERIERQLRNDKTLDETGWWALETFYGTFGRLQDGYSQVPARLADYESLLHKWDKAQPGSVAVPLLLAKFHEHKAWEARGNGFAGEVSKRQWEGFRRNMEKAAQALSLKPEQQMANPAWYAITLTMANSLSLEPEKFAALLARGLSLAPEFGTLVQSVGVASARKWGGSPEYLEALAQVALKAGGPVAYARTYAMAMRTTGCNCEYEPEELLMDWDAFMKGAREDIALKNSARAVNQYAALACNTAHMSSLTELTPALLNVGKAMSVWKDYERVSTCLPWAERLETRTVFVH